MIRLIDLLNENRYAPLYHATNYVNLLSIIEDGFIKPNELGYIFLTRDKRYRVGGVATPVVFVVNQEKVRQRYKVTPRVGSIANKDQRIEAEEVVKGKIPLDWVEEIQVPEDIIVQIKQAIESEKEYIEWAKSKNKGPEYVAALMKDIENYTKVLEHPKLKVITKKP